MSIKSELKKTANLIDRMSDFLHEYVTDYDNKLTKKERNELINLIQESVVARQELL